MQKRLEDLQLSRIVASYWKMNDKDRLALEAFATASANESPRKVVELLLIQGGRGAT